MCLRRSAHFQKQHLEEVRKVAVDVLEKEVVVLRRLGVLSLVPATDSKLRAKEITYLLDSRPQHHYLPAHHIEGWSSVILPTPSCRRVFTVYLERNQEYVVGHCCMQASHHLYFSQSTACGCWGFGEVQKMRSCISVLALLPPSLFRQCGLAQTRILQSRGSNYRPKILLQRLRKVQAQI